MVCYFYLLFLLQDWLIVAAWFAHSLVAIKIRKPISMYNELKRKQHRKETSLDQGKNHKRGYKLIKYLLSLWSFICDTGKKKTQFKWKIYVCAGNRFDLCLTFIGLSKGWNDFNPFSIQFAHKVLHLNGAISWEWISEQIIIIKYLPNVV